MEEPPTQQKDSDKECTNNEDFYYEKSRRKILRLAILSRIIVLAFMIASHEVVSLLSSSFGIDIYPGDDVLQFNLRFEDFINNDDNKDLCFCMARHACNKNTTQKDYHHHEISSSQNYNGNQGASYSSSFCADNCKINDNAGGNKPAIMKYAYKRFYSPKDVVIRFYTALLTPLTRWDSARFLTIAIDPYARYGPTSSSLNDKTRYDKYQHEQQRQCKTDDESNTSGNGICDSDNDILFLPSEQAHAFFPGLPLLIRMMSKLIILAMAGMPYLSMVLPPTYEGVIVLSALLLNIICFITASLALHKLTYVITKHHSSIIITRQGRKEKKGVATKQRNNKEKGLFISKQCINLADVAATLYCFNPASVFFTAAYSESLFSMLIFIGHTYFFSGMAGSASYPTHHTAVSTMLHLAGVLHFAAASYVRSNGTMSSAYILLHGISQFTSTLLTTQYSSQSHGNIDNDNFVNKSSTKSSIGNKIFTILPTMSIQILYHMVLSFVVALPVFYHDYKGYMIHCHPTTTILTSVITPSWCTSSISRSYSRGNHDYNYFSLYKYVQRKHWNVGFLRYFTIKQIPNFLLASPILVLSFIGVYSWILFSWKAYDNYTGVNDNGSKNKRQNTNTEIMTNEKSAKPLTPTQHQSTNTEAEISAKEDSEKPFSQLLGKIPSSTNQSKTNLHNSMKDSSRLPPSMRNSILHTIRWPLYALKASVKSNKCLVYVDFEGRNNTNNNLNRFLLMGPCLLQHYAILFAAAFLGLTIAHVQISTRLICSSCPSIYWFLTSLLIAKPANSARGNCDNEDKNNTANQDTETMRSSAWYRIIVFYFVLYNIIGPFMHTNWLPWT